MCTKARRGLVVAYKLELSRPGGLPESLRDQLQPRKNIRQAKFMDYLWLVYLIST